MDPEETPHIPITIDPAALRSIVAGMLVLITCGLLSSQLLKSASRPMPPGVAADPTLARGNEIYNERCVSCHGSKGRGDGPLAANLTGPRPRDLAGETWKFGERPEQVLAVLENGVKGSQMPAWAGILGPDDLNSVVAYLYLLAGKPVPGSLEAKLPAAR